MSHYYNNNEMKSPLARARGLGSGHCGSHHWWAMKLTALALVPLLLWFFYSIMNLITTGASYTAVIQWISTPYVAVLMVIFLGVNFYHAALGKQEVIMDYIPNKKIKTSLLILSNFACFVAAAIGISAVLFITFGG